MKSNIKYEFQASGKDLFAFLSIKTSCDFDFFRS